MTTHMVLVPGFGGFDALGQMRYYAGVTSMFQDWRRSRARPAMLHYYDNVPTASVATRAEGLRRFLAKLVVRGVINPPDDRIALVGHSTGGLDIRQVVLDLYTKRSLKQLDAQQSHTPPNEDIRSMINRLVFLSVPQLGTNIADWVKTHEWALPMLTGLLRHGLGLGGVLSKLHVDGRILDRIEKAKSDLPKAIADAQRDTAGVDSKDGWVAAEARQAKADIDLWLSDVHHDFLALNDLRSARAHDPAYNRLVDDAARGGDEERKTWRDANIRTRSYATIGRWPFAGNGPPARRRGELASLSALKAAFQDESASEPPDSIYRTAYAACATGPFAPGERIAARWLVPPKQPGFAATHAPEPWENDGVVNTASMLWPDKAETLLVSGDHADIIGHYELQPVAKTEKTEKTDDTERGRKHDAYDLLGSKCRFDGAAFEKIWFDVFDFAAQ